MASTEASPKTTSGTNLRMSKPPPSVDCSTGELYAQHPASASHFSAARSVARSPPFTVRLGSSMASVPSQRPSARRPPEQLLERQPGEHSDRRRGEPPPPRLS